MDDKSYKNFKSVLRSMTYYGRKNPPVNYENSKFHIWLLNHATENTQIKLTHANFAFNSIVATTEEYFRYLLDNSKVADRYDFEFLTAMPNIDLFAENNELGDMREEILDPHTNLNTGILNQTVQGGSGITTHRI